MDLNERTIPAPMVPPAFDRFRRAIFGVLAVAQLLAALLAGESYVYCADATWGLAAFLLFPLDRFVLNVLIFEPYAMLAAVLIGLAFSTIPARMTRVEVILWTCVVPVAAAILYVGLVHATPGPPQHHACYP